jgi:leader peptidase (prepilin peptidase)/N-methyltransferase
LFTDLNSSDLNSSDLNSWLAIAAGLFGLVFGSFLNVCIYRIPRDLSVIAPRSFCPECGEQIAWHDNIPLVSYLMLGGRGRCCRKAIGVRYLIVELTTAAAFVVVVLRYGLTLAALKWIIFESMVIVLFWTDLEERILPDELTVGGTVLGLVLAFFVAVPGFLGEMFVSVSQPAWRSLLNAGAGAVFLAIPIWLLAVLYQRIRNREGLGLGDVKLLAFLGVFLGVEQGMAALLIGAVAGSVIGIIYIAVRRKAALTYELPFGSFLCAGAALMPLLNQAGQVFGASPSP